ncbi:uncharacterized protein LOC123400128 isoform X1 [Hordeum vulgare subsp. vulgare]|uniref:uncharacterized protein LOC123400128 isoform X1 n=1 Tax=Hordeum vulgare subsp. vulgare TaxID=112509 RepID=UPI001D1A338E|nr:uncharacterized protein LOC123400128 isoform X1 [Hordeum vulgare subsp. vulgare]XP_044950475.1 uncharacterized protein LOC123400128 isoform X1 [Hordeum vulgare subsp. vulgare]
MNFLANYAEESINVERTFLNMSSEIKKKVTRNFTLLEALFLPSFSEVAAGSGPRSGPWSSLGGQGTTAATDLPNSRTGIHVGNFISIANNSYSRQQILSMEKNILNSMAWNLTVPTPYVFLVRFAKAAGGDKEGACQDARHGSRRCPAEQAQGHLQEVLLRAVWACVPARPRSCPSTRPEKDLISCSYNLSYCRMHAP